MLLVFYLYCVSSVSCPYMAFDSVITSAVIVWLAITISEYTLQCICYFNVPLSDLGYHSYPQCTHPKTLHVTLGKYIGYTYCLQDMSLVSALMC